MNFTTQYGARIRHVTSVTHSNTTNAGTNAYLLANRSALHFASFVATEKRTRATQQALVPTLVRLKDAQRLPARARAHDSIRVRVRVDASTSRIERVHNAFEFARAPVHTETRKRTEGCTRMYTLPVEHFAVATMLYGNNVQTNDSDVAVVITSGARWAFPLFVHPTYEVGLEIHRLLLIRFFPFCFYDDKQHKYYCT